MDVRFNCLPSFSIENSVSKMSKQAGESKRVEYLTSRYAWSSDWAQLKAGEMVGMDFGICSNLERNES